MIEIMPMRFLNFQSINFNHEIFSLGGGSCDFQLEISQPIRIPSNEMSLS